MNYLKDIFEGNQNKNYIHQRFVRYGRGRYNGPKISLKKSKKTIKIYASYGFENILGYILLKSFNGVVDVRGNIISFEDIGDTLPLLGINTYKERKRRMVFIYKIIGKYDTKTLLGLYEEFPSCIFLFDISATEYKLKTKNSIPKPGSPLDENFCYAEFPLKDKSFILNEICFGQQLSDFDEIRIWYEYTINSLEIPEKYKNNPKMARIHAKRHGIVKRVILSENIENIMETEIRV